MEDIFIRSNKMIVRLQDENATLKLALGKLLTLCENTKMQDKSETWWHIMGVAKEAMENTKYKTCHDD